MTLAPGAGTTMENPLLVSLAEALADRGNAVMRFNFVYHERSQKRPDPQKKLLETTRAAANFLAQQCPGKKLVLAGKSMGGRMASLAVAGGYTSSGLVFLGYPLHPPGKPEKMRDGHLKNIPCPMLFIQGTRDPLCDLELLSPVISSLGGRAAVHKIEGGDHSFEVRKRDNRTPESVLTEIVNAIDGWLHAHVL
ncbi:MAG: dienelactone hydrolase family protein [Polyangiaceae bacterium]|nr:dienelactone hydrolase family protein [Polyangiaceae bacterium]